MPPDSHAPRLDLAGFGTQSAPRMASESKANPELQGGRQSGAKPRDERQARLAEALRENLKKRKAQARGRDAARPKDGNT